MIAAAQGFEATATILLTNGAKLQLVDEVPIYLNGDAGPWGLPFAFSYI